MRLNRQISNWLQAVGVLYGCIVIGTLIMVAFEPTILSFGFFGLSIFLATRLWTVGCEREAAACAANASRSE